MWWRCSVGLMLLGCQVEDRCPGACAAAGDAVETCLEADGLDWSARGWSGPHDFRDWCATWIWEQQRLDRTGDDACADARELRVQPCSEVLLWPPASH